MLFRNRRKKAVQNILGLYLFNCWKAFIDKELLDFFGKSNSDMRKKSYTRPR